MLPLGSSSAVVVDDDNVVVNVVKGVGGDEVDVDALVISQFKSVDVVSWIGFFRVECALGGEE